ncbi:hypothetical protein JRI60_27660 [Archangium violaceum]|uniref:hypothetical protein n=1 Tax=Archangium violaceum TaxID=83451 RepID=UPI00194DDFFB|nr:hypothetical protein [Archangium violaceum]QRO03070.1 hypothetical protein JRI60_27660 [Archangium violaceum]
MSFTSEQLLAIARNYWRADKTYHFRADNGPEYERLCGLWEEALKKIDRWWAFLDELKTDLPEFTIGDATATPDACFRCAAYSPVSSLSNTRRFVVVGCVSILAPVYTVYGVEYERIANKRHNPRAFFEPFPAEMHNPADVVSRRIEATFRVNALPREIADTPIPFYVEPMEPPNTTLFHAFFTSAPESLP